MSGTKASKTYTAELFLKEKHTLGESPFYDARTKTLSWVDIAEGKFFTLRPDGTRQFVSYEQKIGSAVPAEKPGTYLIAGTDGLYLENADGSKPLLNKLDTLFITSAATGQTGELDGYLFTCKVDVKGLECDYCKI